MCVFEVVPSESLNLRTGSPRTSACTQMLCVEKMSIQSITVVC